MYARYPLKVDGKWISPMEYYTRDKAKGIIDDAKFVVEEIKTHLKEMAGQKP